MDQKQFEAILARHQVKLRDFVNRQAPVIAANVAVQMFKENFQREAFFGSRWKEVQRRQPTVIRNGKTIVNKIKGAARSRKILTGATGNLGASIQYRTTGAGQAEVISDLPYSAAHNDGNPRRNLPKRPFMGDHPKLTAATMTALAKKINLKCVFFMFLSLM